ncbi:MAG: peptidase M22 [Clostridia bacterium]|nr:peptidase M22 [Clostridia bacterium]
MDKLCYVGIDTSNYTTSAAICDERGNVLANLKRPLPVAEGGCGLRQSDALFAHVKNLPSLMQELGERLDGYRVAAVGVSARPRDVEGSYMPCFLAGEAAAAAFAAGRDVPVYSFSHQSGHIMAAAYSSGESEKLLSAPFCAFHVSGGTTEIVRVEPRTAGFDVTLLGGTRDLNAGQAIDRVGVAMGLKFPCGPELERLALANTAKIPKPKICVDGLECNLSGLENLARGLYQKEGSAELCAAYVLRFVGETLRALTRNLRERYEGVSVLFAGGVMSNSIIKNMLGGEGNVYFSEPAFSADNAAGVSLLCRAARLAGGERV